MLNLRRHEFALLVAEFRLSSTLFFLVVVVIIVVVVVVVHLSLLFVSMKF